MMRILVFGGDGMLGHQLAQRLQPRHQVGVTIRSRSDTYRRLSGLTTIDCFDAIDVRNADLVSTVVARFAPDAVVNCVGIVKQRGLQDAAEPVEVNTRFPHRLAQICHAHGARLIHISTDCVFSGRKGMYTEVDKPDPADWYGQTKAAGEVEAPRCLTLRTSMIGKELRNSRGLLEWFLAQTGTVHGYRRAVFSGLTTIALSHAIETILVQHPNLDGLRHISSAPIDKYSLLMFLRDHFHRDIEIEPNDDVVIDRSLDAALLYRETGYCPPSWPEMVSEL
jgi:dTDP-4-dehydrorhamnose reductase